MSEMSMVGPNIGEVEMAVGVRSIDAMDSMSKVGPNNC